MIIFFPNTTIPQETFKKGYHFRGMQDDEGWVHAFESDETANVSFITDSALLLTCNLGEENTDIDFCADSTSYPFNADSKILVAKYEDTGPVSAKHTENDGHLEIYPNPANDRINLKFPNSFSKETEVYISNAMGHVIDYQKNYWSGICSS